MNKSSGFTMVKNYILRSNRFSVGAKTLFMLMKSHNGEDGCYPGIAILAEEFPCSKKSIQTYLDELESKGAITRSKRATQYGNHSNAYVLNESPEIWTGTPERESTEKKTGKTKKEQKKEQISGTDQSSDSCTPFSLSTSLISDATYITSDIKVKPYSADGQEHNTKIILNNPKDQVSEDYPMDYIKGQIGYNDLINGGDPVPCDLADLAANVIHDAVNNPKPTYKIRGGDIRGSAVQSVFLKLDSEDIRCAIKQYDDYQKNSTIYNQKSFMISTLYMERSQGDKGNQNKPKYIGFNNFESKPVFEGDDKDDEPPVYSDAWLRKHKLIG